MRFETELFPSLFRFFGFGLAGKLRPAGLLP
jgi:hypothetical protein